jgi:hypothetical protein
MPHTTTGYAVSRVNADRYRLDRTTQDEPRPIAFAERAYDRARAPVGWRLRPLVSMRGSPSTLWPAPADALASTKLFTVTTAVHMVGAADLAAAPGASPPA